MGEVPPTIEETNRRVNRTIDEAEASLRSLRGLLAKVRGDAPQPLPSPAPVSFPTPPSPVHIDRTQSCDTSLSPDPPRPRRTLPSPEPARVLRRTSLSDTPRAPRRSSLPPPSSAERPQRAPTSLHTSQPPRRSSLPSPDPSPRLQRRSSVSPTVYTRRDRETSDSAPRDASLESRRPLRTHQSDRGGVRGPSPTVGRSSSPDQRRRTYLAGPPRVAYLSRSSTPPKASPKTADLSVLLGGDRPQHIRSWGSSARCTRPSPHHHQGGKGETRRVDVHHMTDDISRGKTASPPLSRPPVLPLSPETGAPPGSSPSPMRGIPTARPIAAYP
eukprot:Sspe_Gene.26902::Locus_11361_Transcript_1_1_Confidence_1.000_Length_1171::g.26902::m.26902